MTRPRLTDSTWKPGDRVTTPDGPGKIVGPFLERGLSRHGDLVHAGWIVALDSGRRRVHTDVTACPDET